ncbi:MAG: hypothetical protein N2446_03850 [Elusimicrobiales bacterium]|nr:hypothetical protein [Elusimicrobiales bacterium]
MNRKIFFIFFLLSVEIYVHSSIKDTFSDKARGQSVFSVLKSPISPYFYSFGGAGSAVLVEDNVFLNPASMYTNYSNSFFIGFHKNNVDSFQTDFAFLYRRKYNVIGGFSFSYIDYGDFLKINENGNIIGKFSPYDFVLSYSYGWGRKERFGFRVKYVESNLVYEKSRGIAFDFGFNLKNKNSGLSITVKNIGPSAKISSKYYSLPFEIATGFNYIYSRNLKGVFELKFPVDNKAYTVGGVEYKIEYNIITFCFRIGVNTLNFRELGWSGIFSGGFGLYSSGVGFEYSFIPYSNIDNIHKIVLKYSFGNFRVELEEEKNKFEEFVLKEISLKKKIAVFDFKSKDFEYSSLIANSIEEKLIEKKHSVISRLDPLYISNSKKFYEGINDIIEVSKKMGIDYAVWGEIIKDNDIKASFNIIIISIKDNKIKEYSLTSNIYDIKNITTKFVDEISSFIHKD